jgi:hypothetical protein
MEERVYLIVDRKSGKVLAECDSLARAQSMYLQFRSYSTQTGAELDLTSRPVDAAAAADADAASGPPAER